MMYFKTLRRSFDFSGRSTRYEYFTFITCNILCLLSLGCFDTLFVGIPILTILFCMLMSIPTLAVAVRRLHDTDRSGTLLFFYFVPVVGPIWLLIHFLERSDQGTNYYGEQPKK